MYWNMSLLINFYLVDSDSIWRKNRCVRDTERAYIWSKHWNHSHFCKSFNFLKVFLISLLFMHAWLYIITLIYFHDSFTGFSHWGIRAKSTIAILHKTWRMPQENRNRKVIQIIYEKLWFNEYHISTQAMAQWLCLIRNLTYKVQLHFHLLSSFQEETVILHLRPEVPP